MVSVVLAGGGTAGHTSPLIATAQALKVIDPRIAITCVGTARGLETRVIPQAGLPLELVPAVPMPRKAGLDLARLPLRLTGAVYQAGAILRRSRADVVVGFGGYASLPAYLAARLRGVPVVVHEQNALPGMANKVAARFAARVFTAFPDTPLAGARFIGMPLRRGITELAEQGRAGRQVEVRERFGLAPDLPVLLVSGGSQGARSLNDVTVDAVPRLLAAGVQVLHVWGPKNFHEGITSQEDPRSGAVYQPVSYLDAMEDGYAAADLMLARSGAGTVAETATFGLPTIMVPLPIGNGEQARNAAGVVAAGGAILISDTDLSADRLVDDVSSLVTTPGRLAEMSAAASELMPPGAEMRLAEAIYQLAKEKEKR